MILWRFTSDAEYSSKNMIEVKYKTLPGIRCQACKRTWIAIMRDPARVPDVLVKKITKLNGPQSNVTIDALRLELNAAGITCVKPGLAYGAVNIKSVVNKSGVDVLWHGGKSFWRRDAVFRLNNSVRERLRFMECEGNPDYLELIPLVVPQMDRFGSRLLCKECGFTDDEHIALGAVKDHLYSKGDFFCVVIPGGTYISDLVADDFRRSKISNMRIIHTA